MNTKDKNSIKPMSQKEYKEVEGGVCPFCKSKDIEGDVIEIGKVGAYQIISCNSCSAIWEDNYKLSSYIVMQEPAKNNKIVNNTKDRGYSECPFCRNKNIVGIRKATIENPAIMQDSICSDCGMTFAAIIGYIGAK